MASHNSSSSSSPRSPHSGDELARMSFGSLTSDGKFVGASASEPTFGGMQFDGPMNLLQPKDLLDMAPWKSVDLILRGLYLGNLQTAKLTRWLQEHKITHIVSVCNDPIPADWPASGIKHLRIPIEDQEHVDLIQYMRPACRFIEEALADRDHTVLVHSEFGKSRSTAVVAAYMMYKYKIGVADACDRIRMAREQTWVNRGFQEQLTIFQIDHYAPDPSRGAYLRWLIKMAQGFQAIQARQAMQRT